MRKCTLLAAVLFAGVAYGQEWQDWEKYRNQVRHPALSIKLADVQRAKENARRHPWAKDYVAKVEQSARQQLGRLTPSFIEKMIPETTPGDRIFTPCPACRDQGKPAHPHGIWDWSENRPEELRCTVCDTTYPNGKYPESVVLRTTWGKPQELTFYGGEPFVVFGYKQGRPSFSGNIRSRKVTYMGDVARNLGEAYALTGDVAFAKGAKSVLLRLAEVYPNWLVHVGYGEYADTDPRTAAANIGKLPKDELVYPPNKPDRKLHTEYWSAGRMSGTGLEGTWLRKVVVAYDLTCEAPGVYTDAERKKIEKDLLLEGSSLLTADGSINNKSVTNRSAAAMIGATVGEPSLVRFGLEGFTRTIDGWFLKDGGTPESWAYGLMALNGVEELTLAMRGYSDPAGYKDPAGGRLDDVNLYAMPVLSRVWDSMFKGLQGNLRFPPTADSYTTTTINARQAEVLAANYPDRPEYLTLLKELCGPSGSGDSSVAVYHREPAAWERPTPKIVMRDYCWPEMRVGHMRTGDDGRESLLVLDASRWGSHHHLDSLNLYYWKNGKELLSDLGYLWDHPKKHETAATQAHNLVVIDEKDQASKERGGDVHFFHSTTHVKAMRASSHAYPQTGVYERTSVLVDHGGGRSYVVDFFRVHGGKTQDYVFHGVNGDYRVTGGDFSASQARPLGLTNVRHASASGVWHVTWDLKDDMAFSAWSLPQPGEKAYVADGWGQRDYKNSDVGATIPYVIRRCEGEGLREFISVFEGHGTRQAVVKSATRQGNIVVVETVNGRDYILSSDGKEAEIDTPAGRLRLSGKVAVVSFRNDKEAWRFEDGK